MVPAHVQLQPDLIIGGIVPHAGYIYSGQTAAEAYATLTNFSYKVNNVVLIGPAHQVFFKGIATLFCYQSFYSNRSYSSQSTIYPRSS